MVKHATAFVWTKAGPVVLTLFAATFFHETDAAASRLSQARPPSSVLKTNLGPLQSIPRGGGYAATPTLGETAPTSTPAAGPLSFVSVAYWTRQPIVSADGRFVLFEAAKAGRDPGDADWRMDAYVHDRRTGETTLVSRPIDGTEEGDYTYVDSISADGRYLVFSSRADNLVPGDTNYDWDIFIYDQITGQTSRVSLASDGRQGNGGSQGAVLSADGKVLAFDSWATNFVGPDENRRTDVFVRDLQTGHTTLVSRATDGTRGNLESGEPAISSDGRYVAFSSKSTNLVGGDSNGVTDVFIHDRLSGETTRVSVDSDGVEGNRYSGSPSISADGQHVAFVSVATNLVPSDTNGEPDLFIHDRLTGETSRVNITSDGSRRNGRLGIVSLSSDLRYVAFDSGASDLVDGDTNAVGDVFIHDRLTGETVRVSLGPDGSQGSLGSYAPSISSDGRHVVFTSGDDLLAEPGAEGRWGIFVLDLRPNDPPTWAPTPTPTPTPTLAPTRTAAPPTGTAASVVPATAPTTRPAAATTRPGCGGSLLLSLILVSLASIWRRP